MPIHAWLARQRRIVVEWLPPYAPELNPVEQVWGHTKYGDLANHTPDSLPELADAVLRSLGRTRAQPRRLGAFVRAAALEHRDVPLLTQVSIEQTSIPGCEPERTRCGVSIS